MNAPDLKSSQTRFFEDSALLFFLSAFGVAQPIFDLLSRNAQFFVVRDLGRGDILLLAITLVFLLPSVLALLVGLALKLNHLAGRILHHLIVAALVTLIALPVLKRLSLGPGLVMVAVAALVGTSGARLLGDLQPIRSGFAAGLLLAAGLFFLASFLFLSPVSSLLSRSDQATTLVTNERVIALTPVVLVIFDELSSVFLMDENQEIDSERFPNFASLAQDSTWYRNASAVADHTTQAVPAILTGNYPKTHEGRPSLPTTQDYPENLFTFLGSSHDLRVVETVTNLCPEELCASQQEIQSFRERSHALYTDLITIYRHIVMPTDLAAQLPDITQSWQDFMASTTPAEALTGKEFVDLLFREVKKDRYADFEKFLSSINPDEPATLHFLHTLLPHAPLNYLPSGKRYGLDSGIGGLDPKTKHWVDDRSAALAQQRYLLQLGFVDTLIGRLQERLRAADLYEKSLIVITADHGVSFRAGDNRRFITPTNYSDILLVPLLVKQPHQIQGSVSDLNIETIDILPTIAASLGTQLPWKADGFDVDDPRLLARRHKTFMAGGRAEEKLTFRSDEVRPTGAERNLLLFGSGSMERTFRSGPYKDLVDQPIASFDIQPDQGCSFELDCLDCYSDVDLESRFSFTQVTGSVKSCDNSGPPGIAVATNGIIRATTTTSGSSDHSTFSAMIPESALRPGSNIITLFGISGSDGQPTLFLTAGRKPTTLPALIEVLDGEEILSSPEGGPVALKQRASHGGTLWAARWGEQQLTLTGWAGDVEQEVSAQAVLVFQNGKRVFSGRTNLERQDLAERFGEGLRWAGFRLSIPEALLSDLDDSEIRVFALSSDGVASELVYFAGFPWGKKFTIREAAGGLEPALLDHEGRVLPLESEAFEGRLTETRSDDYAAIRVVGWAIDPENGEVPDRLAVFSSGKLVHAGKPNVENSRIASRYDNPELLWSRFHYRLPVELIEDPLNPGLRVFAISRRGFATEIQAP